MSVEALLQVFKDHSEVSPGVQAVLIAIAWKTPKDRDATGPVSYSDLARLTRMGQSTVRRLVLQGIGSRHIELVWAKPGQPSRYRVNRGEWFVPGSPEELERALGIIDPAQSERGTDPAQSEHTPAQSELTSALNLSGDPARSEHPLREEEKKEKKEEEPSLFEVRNLELVGRLREKGHIQ